MSTTEADRRQALRAAFLRSRNALLRGREVTAVQRELLIEALGDWLCGGGPPPAAEQVAALEAWSASCAREEAAHAEFIARLVSELAAYPRD